MIPDYIIIGAMKCGTSTLAAQLGAQPGIFMTTPKEPNFFSDDAVYARGMGWYEGLFDSAAPGDFRGEASTHYTKLPDYPETLPRLRAAGEATPRLIYLIRNPLDRLVSHYIHEWTQGVIGSDLARALDTHPALIRYGCYAEQLAPWIAAYGSENLLVLSLEQMKRTPQEVLDRVAVFLGQEGLVWQEDLERVNVSSERIRKLPMQALLVDNPVATALRQKLVPQSVRDWVKARRRMQERPVLSETDRARLEKIFAEDFAALNRQFPDRPDLALSYPFLERG